MQQNICSMCNGSGKTPIYQKQVDPPIRQYGSMLDHRPQRNDFGRKKSEPITAMMVPCPPAPCPPAPCPPAPTIQGPCQPSKGGRSTLIQVPCDPPTPCPKFVCEPCPPPPPIKVWLLKSSPMPQKSFAIAQPPPCCLPGSKPIVISCKNDIV